MRFRYPQKVTFKYCDPAGIVFYPRYFEMVNDATEAMFSDALGAPWEELQQTGNVPTARIEAQFTAPSRFGDPLVIEIEITHLGRSSLGLSFRCLTGTDLRFAASSTIVYIGLDGKSAPWPDPIRTAITAFMEEPDT